MGSAFIDVFRERTLVQKLLLACTLVTFSSGCFTATGVKVDMFVAFKPPDSFELHGSAMTKGVLTPINSTLESLDSPVFATLAPMYANASTPVLGALSPMLTLTYRFRPGIIGRGCVPANAARLKGADVTQPTRLASGLPRACRTPIPTH